MKPSGPGLLCVGSFLKTASISSAVIGLFRFSASYSFRLGRLYFSRNVSISPAFKFLGIQFFIVFLTILCISVVSVVICPLSFLIVFIWILSLFFLMSLLKGLSILFIFSKNQLLDSLILRIVLLVSMPFNSGLIFVISFLLLSLGCLCCCSRSFCRRGLRLFVSIFLS